MTLNKTGNSHQILEVSCFTDVYLHLLCVSLFVLFSLPFPAEEDEEGGGDADRRGPGHPGTGKGLSSEQKDGLDVVKHVMLTLDEEDGLDQIYTFRLEGSYQILDLFCLTSSLLITAFLSTTKSCLHSYWMTPYDLAFHVLHSCRRNAIEQLCMFKRVERRPVAWPCQLTIGSCLSIRIVGYKAVCLLLSLTTETE